MQKFDGIEAQRHNIEDMYMKYTEKWQDCVVNTICNLTEYML